MHEEVYVAIHAQSLQEKRAIHSGKRSSLVKHESLRAYVEQHIRDGWSPEQIAERLRKDYPADVSMRISPEPIYAYIYAAEQKVLRLWEYLPRKHTKRARRPCRKVAKCHIPDRVSIHNRPTAIEDRQEFGHYEGDTVEGKRSVGDGIHTEVERKSRKLFGRKVARITSEATTDAQVRIFSTLPAPARQTTTLDNGKENHGHGQLKTLRMQVYFADPYSSWQRGSNKCHNGLLRRYLPKQTDFTQLTQAELDDIIEEINNRPRKCLDYKTPNEVFYQELEKTRGVRIPTRM